MIDFLAGSLTLGFLVVGAFFFRSWKRTGDRLFVSFALAFWLFAANQVLSLALGRPSGEVRYEYILRVLGFVLIIVGIVRKNSGTSRTGDQRKG
jgi:hypothetical protein